MIFVVRTITNKEEQAADLIAMKAKQNELRIFSIVSPHGMKGYIFVEAPDKETVELAIKNVPYVKGMLNKTIDIAQLEDLLTATKQTYNIEEGDIVEIIGEGFKKAKGKVKRINKLKEEAIVELLEATVPIPITVKLDNLRVIRREKPETGKISESEEKE